MTVNASVMSIIDKGDTIPAMPRIVARLLEVTADPNYRVDDVISLLSVDAGIAADVLRLANSPLFGVTRKVAALGHAINLLGVRRIRTLVMGRCIVEGVKQNGTGIIDLGYYWRRSLATAVLARRFAETITPDQRDEAFMSGLLSDVGIAVLARAVPGEYATAAAAYAPSNGGDVIELEREAVGTTHPEVSALVLERWSLPESMILAVKHHHDRNRPGDLPKAAAEIACIIDGASDIARILCEAPDAGVIVKTCVEAMDVVGLDVSALVDVLKDIEADVAEFASVLKIDVIPSRVYAIIANTIASHLAAPAA